MCWLLLAESGSSIMVIGRSRGLGMCTENKTGKSVGAGAISASAKFATNMCKMLFSVDGLGVRPEFSLAIG